MSDPNAPRRDEHDPAAQHGDAEQPVEGFAVTDEQHAPPSAPAAPGTPGVGEPAQSFSSPAADPAAQAPGQPAFSDPAADDAAREWQHGQQQGQPGSFDQHGSFDQAGAFDQGGQAAGGYGQAPSAPPYGHPGQAQHGQTPSAPQYGQPQQGHAQSAPQHGQPASSPYGEPGQRPYDQGQPSYGQHGEHLGQQPQHGQSHYGAPGQPQYGAPGQPQYAASAPMSPMDEKNAGMWGHLSGLSTIVTGGYGGWIGPLIVFLIYKDRSAFARQESKEALNFGIFMTILTVGLLIVGTILSFVGIGFILLALWWVPGLLQVIFSIIGAMRVNNGGSYRYPFNWRLVN